VVDTALWAKNKTVPGVVETIESQTPLRRWAKPEDIADVIVFLASDAARFITGETISADCEDRPRSLVNAAGLWVGDRECDPSAD
jgi:NAD(P)-dependent dehydrogenase (short-subunit alcohol dehydrogenase family)